MADNTARDYFRQAVRRQVTEIDSVGVRSVQDIPSPAGDAEQELRLKEWLSQSLKQLAPIDREILTMVIDGYRLPEIAEATGLSYSNAGVRLSRLRARLRRLTEQTS
jgi:RNA polymerase sigma factor (sigma-70 family)